MPELHAIFGSELEALRRTEGVDKVDLEQLKENMMTDVAKLQDITARLQASDAAALAALQQLKDQNVTLAAQLSTIQTGDPATQKAIDDVVSQLTDTADTVDRGVAANPATPNLTPSPATPPAKPPTP